VPLGGFEFGEKSMERKPILQKGVDAIFPYFVPLPNLKREYNKNYSKDGKEIQKMCFVPVRFMKMGSLTVIFHFCS
jgi:hypothetical protein